jgi:hypothetical protein
MTTLLPIATEPAAWDVASSRRRRPNVPTRHDVSVLRRLCKFDCRGGAVLRWVQVNGASLVVGGWSGSEPLINLPPHGFVFCGRQTSRIT